jgi:4-hydroxy-2-oxovalerate aldolase
MPELHLLECTLRDGSYVIDFQFSERDTMIIAAALENAGIDLIEIGHGLGLNASAAGKGQAAESDQAYLRAASRTLKRARWGMFFIPGVGRHEDLDMAASYGMSFVRVGTNASEVVQSQAYIEHAKRLGLFVSANLMKSYTMPPAELAEHGSLSAEYGADVVCVVDSAGGMMPEDVRAYIQAMRGAIDVPVGFHGHDNLSLGIANVLAAVDAGATYVDSTLRGMGRGGGNPPTEVLVAVLKKRGIDLGVDMNRLMDLSERIIKPMLPSAGLDPIDITSGYAQFHSSYLKTILKYSNQYEVDPRDLIVAVCEVDQTYAPEELVEEIAKRLQAERPPVELRSSIAPLDIPAPDDDQHASSARSLAHRLRSEARKRSKLSVVNIVAAQQPTGHAVISPFIQEEFEFVIGSLEIGAADQLDAVLEAVDGTVDVLLVDANQREFLPRSLAEDSSAKVRSSRLLAYSDSELWARTVMYELKALGALPGTRVVVAGVRPEARRLAAQLADQGFRIVLSGGPSAELERTASAVRGLGGAIVEVEPEVAQAVRNVRAVAAFHVDRPVLDRAALARVDSDTVVFDATIGAVARDAIQAAVERGIRVVRPDMRASMAGELAAQLGVAATTGQLMGRGEIAGYPVVAGGLVGAEGDVVLDSFTNPTRVVGVADGQGRLLPADPGYADRIKAVESALAGRQALLRA